jgi:hypothetical protein
VTLAAYPDRLVEELGPEDTTVVMDPPTNEAPDKEGYDDEFEYLDPDDEDEDEDDEEEDEEDEDDLEDDEWEEEEEEKEEEETEEK